MLRIVQNSCDILYTCTIAGMMQFFNIGMLASRTGNRESGYLSMNSATGQLIHHSSQHTTSQLPAVNDAVQLVSIIVCASKFNAKYCYLGPSPNANASAIMVA